MQYWFNIVTKQVEEDGQHSKKEDLLGPYPTRQEAAQALSSAAARTAAWDEEDRLREEEEAAAQNREPRGPGLGLL